MHGDIAKLDPAEDCLKKTLDWTGCAGESPSSKPETAIWSTATVSCTEDGVNPDWIASPLEPPLLKNSYSLGGKVCTAASTAFRWRCDNPLVLKQNLWRSGGMKQNHHPTARTMLDSLGTPSGHISQCYPALFLGAYEQYLSWISNWSNTPILRHGLVTSLRVEFKMCTVYVSQGTWLENTGVTINHLSHS